MHLYKILILIICATNLFAKYTININFESGFQYKSQDNFISKLEKLNSKHDIEQIIKDQDWIKSYSIMHKPFSKVIFLTIKNREPIFVLNDDFFYDEDLKKFKFYKAYKKLITVNGPIQNIEEIQKIINEMKLSKLNFDSFTITYSFVNGWDVKTDKFLIRFGKDLSKNKFKKFQDTSNYLYDNTKIPSIIDMRYRDGVAINYGK